MSCPKSEPKARIPYTAIKLDPPRQWFGIAKDLEALKTQPIVSYPRNLCSYLNLKVTSACIATLALARVDTELEWSDEVLKKVLKASDDICAFYMKEMRQMKRFHIPVECICTEFFLGSIKVNILIQLAAKGDCLETCSFDSEKIQQLLGSNDGVLLQDSGRTFAFWRIEEMTYTFTLDLSDNGLLMPFLGRSADVNSILKYIQKIICGNYKLFCFKLISWRATEKSLDRVTLQYIGDGDKPMKPCQNVQTTAKPDDTTSTVRDDEFEDGVTIATEVSKIDTSGKAQISDILTAISQYEEIVQQTTLQYSKDFKDIEEDVSGILQAGDFVSVPNSILHHNIAIAILQYHFPANLWTTRILDKSMDMGKVIYRVSKEEVKNEDWTKRVRLPVKFGTKYFDIKYEKKIIGIVSPSNSDVLSITAGVAEYFKKYDRGLLVGPQTVLIWQEKGRFFMFDAKERNHQGKKWTHFNSVGGDCETSCGNACVTWYIKSELLAEAYESNIALKYRSDSYRIVNLIITETQPELEYYEFWKALSPIKWVLVGTKSICDYERFSLNSRSDIAVHTSIAAIAKSIRKPESEWGPDDINDIFANGTELCDQVQSLAPAEEEIVETFNVKKIYTLENTCIEAIVEEGRVTGKISIEKSNKPGFPLKKGIPLFFKTRQYAILFHRQAAVAIWRGEDNYYYLFYPYETRLKPQHCPECTNVLTLGFGYALRVKNVHDLAKHLLFSMSFRPNDEYSLNAVTVRLSDLSTLKFYRAFSEYGAILLPFNDFHEGHEIFCARANRQTIANTVVALSLNHIKISKNWNSEDVTDILYMGDLIFCQIQAEQEECKSKDYQLLWDDVKPIIGLSKFTFERTVIEGVITPPDLDSVFDEGEEGLNESLGEEFEDYEYVGTGRKKAEVFAGVTLRSALDKWEKEEKLLEAVLETDLYRVALWKNDNLFFVFDPRAPTGFEEYMLDLMGEEEGEGEGEGELGSLFPKVNGAYVACFTNFETFYGHFIEKLSIEHRQGTFVLNELIISNEPIEVVKPDREVTEFRKISDELAVLRGNMTQREMIHRSVESQMISNCIISLGFALIMPHDQITTKLIDLILKYGYRYNSKRYKALQIPVLRSCTQEADENDAPSKVQVIDFSTQFILFNLKFQWKIESQSTDIFQKAELKTNLSKLGMIKSGFVMLLEHKNYVNSLWKRDKFIYLFEPSDSGPEGMLATKGVPSIVRFRKNEVLVDHLIEKFFPENGESNFTSYTLRMTYFPVPPMGSEPVNELTQIMEISKLPEYQNMFRKIGEHVRVFTHFGSTELCPLNLLCLAALIYSQITCVEFWNIRIFEKIKSLGASVAKHSNYGLKKFPKDLKIPLTEVNLNLTVDTTLCTVALQKNTQGPIICSNKMESPAFSLKNSLLNFISDCNYFIITISNIAFGIWKENNHFYAFGAVREHPKEMFVIASDDITSLYDEMFRRIYNVQDERNWYDLQNVEVKTTCVKGTVYEKCWQRSVDTSCKKRKLRWHECKPIPKVKHRNLKKESEMNDNDGIEFIYAKNPQCTKEFFGSHDFLPSLQAACVAAAVMSRLSNPLTWHKDILEAIMITGNNLFLNAKAVAGKNFKMTDLCGIVYMYNLRLNIHITEPVSKSGEEDVCSFLIDMLRKHQIIYVVAECFSFIIIRGLQFSFLYNPGTMEPFCNEMPIDSSFLIKCGTLTDLIRKLLKNCSSMSCECLQIGAIRVE